MAAHEELIGMDELFLYAARVAINKTPLLPPPSCGGASLRSCQGEAKGDSEQVLPLQHLLHHGKVLFITITEALGKSGRPKTASNIGGSRMPAARRGGEQQLHNWLFLELHFHPPLAPDAFASESCYVCSLRGPRR